jgi:ribose/xylose/arabinose/galactoside ABC-type transport system permease subunit
MATQSIKSDALEPDLSDLRGKGAKGLLTGALRLFPVYGLVFITLLLIVIFSVLLPDTFFTWLNARLILSNQSGTALLALAAMIPMVAGKIDLSIGYGVVLWEVLKAQAAKTIICVSSDSRNGGVKGVADGLAEAAKAIGWNFRVIDGRGEVEGRGQALGQAIAFKPQGIVVYGFDAKEEQTLADQANAQGIALVGWHAGATPGST